MELLSLAGGNVSLCMIADLFKDLAEMGWAVQTSSVESMLIAVDHTFDTRDTWVEDIAIEGKAVRSTRWVRRDSTSKAVQVDHFI